MNPLQYRVQLSRLFLLLAYLISVTGMAGSALAQEPESTTQVKDNQTEARKFDEYGEIKFDDEKARLDNLAIELQSNPKSQSFIVAYGTCEGEATRRADRAKDYLVNARGIDFARVVTVDGGCLPDLTVELWVVPFGATPPAASVEKDPSACPACKRAPRRRARNGSTSATSFWSDIPDFPWPPPTASAVATVPRSLVENSGGTTRLADVGARLEGAFYQAGYGEMSWYRVPEGFAMVSRLEQFNNDGTPLQGDDRFSAELARPPASLTGLIKDLFFAREGHYRVVVFMVTSLAVQQSPQRMSRRAASDLVSSGADRLPENTGSQPFTGNHKCTALIYEFFQRTADHPAEFVSPGRLDGTTHLRRSGILNALEGIRR